MWKKKMLLFLQVANPKYLDVLKKGPKIPMVVEPKVIEDDVVITKARTYVKDPEDFSPAEKEEASLDASLQLILVDSLDPLMNIYVMNCKNSKHIWETIKEKESLKCLRVPTHLEHRITAIREARDLNEISLERLYGVLKTYELEQIQQKEVYGKGRVVSTSIALVAEEQQQQPQQQQQQSQQSERMVQSSKAEENMIVAEFDPPTTNQSGDDFYSLEELEQLEDESMALIVKRFSNVRFKRNPKFKPSIRFSSDEAVAYRLATNDVQIFDSIDFKKGIVKRIRVSGISGVEISKRPGSHVAAFVPEFKVFWDYVEKKKLGTTKAEWSVTSEWSPDGRYFLTATTAPRLQVDNGIKIFHHNGSMYFKKMYDKLYQVDWKPESPESFGEIADLAESIDSLKVGEAKTQGPKSSQTSTKSTSTNLAVQKPAAYQPPHAKSAVAVQAEPRFERSRPLMAALVFRDLTLPLRFTENQAKKRSSD
ncbi:hypothetical protein AgCh_039291 [Apium graveolens]